MTRRRLRTEVSLCDLSLRERNELTGVETFLESLAGESIDNCVSSTRIYVCIQLLAGINLLAND